MGTRLVTRNVLGHKSHMWLKNNPEIMQPDGTPILCHCWCGEIVEQVV